MWYDKSSGIFWRRRGSRWQVRISDKNWQYATPSTTLMRLSTVEESPRIAVITDEDGLEEVVQLYAIPDLTADSITTLTHKRITKRVTSLPSSTTPEFDTDSWDQCEILNLTDDITNATFTGVPTNGQHLALVLRSASNQSISLGSMVIGGPAPLLSTTNANKFHEVLLKYNSTALKWVVMQSDSNGY